MQLALTTLLAVLAATASSLGINCQGSSECYRGKGTAASRLNSYIQAGPDNRWFNNKQQIACVDASTDINHQSAICAYLQNTGGAPLKNIKGLAPRILEHGCKNCGSVPYFYPADNNVDNGELTFNFVTKGCNAQYDSGLCPEYYIKPPKKREPE
ncbi:MAG: hypothetical protein L6R38_001339 [Xanthoria sp. 2 TBL-2021]|nr:MAG: hypothetical protein L6R38_001339 [Xanthoria sp. 2 TBL-2021]